MKHPMHADDKKPYRCSRDEVLLIFNYSMQFSKFGKVCEHVDDIGLPSNDIDYLGLFRYVYPAYDYTMWSR